MENREETNWDVHLLILKISTPLMLTGFFTMFSQ
jgi:multidrug resistance protein, MATE family